MLRLFSNETSNIWALEQRGWIRLRGNHQCFKSRVDLKRWANTFDVERYRLFSNNCQTFVLQLVAYAIDKDVVEAKVMIEETLGMPLS